MKTGVAFRLASGETDEYRVIGKGLIEARFRYAPDRVARTVLAQGVYMIEAYDIIAGSPDPNTRVSYGYAMPPAQMLLPRPGGGFSAVALVLEAGAGVSSQTHVYSFGAMTRVGFGPCSYDMIPVTMRLPEDEPAYAETLHYLPELGLAYFAAARGDGYEDVYDYVAIRALR